MELNGATEPEVKPIREALNAAGLDDANTLTDHLKLTGQPSSPEATTAMTREMVDAMTGPYREGREKVISIAAGASDFVEFTGAELGVNDGFAEIWFHGAYGASASAKGVTQIVALFDSSSFLNLKTGINVLVAGYTEISSVQEVGGNLRINIDNTNGPSRTYRLRVIRAHEAGDNLI